MKCLQHKPKKKKGNENEKKFYTFFKAFLFTLENYLRNVKRKIKVPVPLREIFVHNKSTFDIKKIFRMQVSFDFKGK